MRCYSEPTPISAFHYTDATHADEGPEANTMAKPCEMLWGRRCAVQGKTAALEG